MSSTDTDQTRVLDIGHRSWVYTVTFHPDGKHILGGSRSEIRQWRLADGHEVGRQTGMTLSSISVSNDHKWIALGTWDNGASVWDEELHQKVVDVEGTNYVGAVDISPDSTRFVTTTGRNSSGYRGVNIWSLPSGKRLVGPLEYDKYVTGIKFSSDGDRIAAACSGGLIHLFNSRNGDRLITIKSTIPQWTPATPITWSGDDKQIFVAFRGKTIRSFRVSTGSQLAESPILDGDDLFSFALAPNGKFIAAFMQPHSISFLDPSTLTRISSDIEDKDSQRIRSIAISPNSCYLATGREDGKIIIRDLSKILPDSCGPFNVSTREGQDEQPLTSGGNDNETPGSNPTRPEGHDEDGDGDLLEVEVPGAQAPDFDYDEPLSPTSSADHREGGISPPEARPGRNLDTAKSSQGHSIFRMLLQRKSKKDPNSHEPSRHSGISHPPADHRSPSHSPAKVSNTNRGPSRMAAAERNARTSTGFTRRPKRKPRPQIAKHPNDDTSNNGQGAADPRAADAAQQANDSSQPPAARVHVLHQEGSDDAFVSIRCPAWLLCIRPGAHDEMH